MKTKKEVPQAVKQFAKEIGAPDAIICDAAGEQTSGALRAFCHKIGTTLRLVLWLATMATFKNIATCPGFKGHYGGHAEVYGARG